MGCLDCIIPVLVLSRGFGSEVIVESVIGLLPSASGIKGSEFTLYTALNMRLVCDTSLQSSSDGINFMNSYKIEGKGGISILPETSSNHSLSNGSRFRRLHFVIFLRCRYSQVYSEMVESCSRFRGARGLRLSFQPPLPITQVRN